MHKFYVETVLSSLLKTLHKTILCMRSSKIDITNFYTYWNKNFLEKVLSLNFLREIVRT